MTALLESIDQSFILGVSKFSDSANDCVKNIALLLLLDNLPSNLVTTQGGQ